MEREARGSPIMCRLPVSGVWYMRQSLTIISVMRCEYSFRFHSDSHIACFFQIWTATTSATNSFTCKCISESKPLPQFSNARWDCSFALSSTVIYVPTIVLFIARLVTYLSHFPLCNVLPAIESDSIGNDAIHREERFLLFYFLLPVARCLRLGARVGTGSEGTA